MPARLSLESYIAEINIFSLQPGIKFPTKTNTHRIKTVHSKYLKFS